jgi:hypothetical protein
MRRFFTYKGPIEAAYHIIVWHEKEAETMIFLKQKKALLKAIKPKHLKIRLNVLSVIPLILIRQKKMKKRLNHIIKPQSLKQRIKKSAIRKALPLKKRFK